MTLGKLIKILESQDASRIIKHGFGNPHSWRGSYDELSFEPVENILVGEMLEQAKGCIGETFEGWKGGVYVFDEDTPINIDYRGDWSDGDQLWKIALDLMFQD